MCPALTLVTYFPTWEIRLNGGFGSLPAWVSDAEMGCIPAVLRLRRRGCSDRRLPAASQYQVDDILTYPGSQIVQRSHPTFGKILDVVAPDGRGVRFGSDGRFIDFLEPPQ